jgi:Tfp pilus assembly protein PilN
MKLSLNLATAPLPNNRPFIAVATAAGSVAVVLLMILSGVAYKSWRADRELRTETSAWRARIQEDLRRQQQLQQYFRSPEAEQILERSAFLNSLIDARSFPWTRIFMDLENTLPPGVRVISISPRLDGGRAEVALQVGALSDEAKIQFLEAIEKSKTFSGLVVKSERPSPEASGDRVVMELTVWYTTT